MQEEWVEALKSDDVQEGADQKRGHKAFPTIMEGRKCKEAPALYRRFGQSDCQSC